MIAFCVESMEEVMEFIIFAMEHTCQTVAAMILFATFPIWIIPFALYKVFSRKSNGT